MPGNRLRLKRLVLFAHGCACLLAALTIHFVLDGSLLALLPLPLLVAGAPSGGAAALAAVVLCVVYAPNLLPTDALVPALCIAFCVPFVVAGAARRVMRGHAGAPAWTGRLRGPLFALSAVLFLLTMHRSYPLYELLSFAAAHAASAWGLPLAETREARGGWRAAAANGALLVLSVTLALAAGEFAFRRVFGPPSPVHTVSHPERIWTPGPHTTRVKRLDDPKFGKLVFESRYGAQGLRERDYGPKPAGVCRVLLLGDSFTYGDGLEWDQTYGMVLENLLNEAAGGPRFEVVNAGVPGYGTTQELSLLREIGFALEPDIVLLQILITNDISDDLVFLDKHQEAYSEADVAPRIFRRRGGGWILRAHQALRGRSTLYSNLWQTNPDYAILHFLARLRFLPNSRYPQLPPSADRPWYLEALLREWPPVMDEGWAICQENVREMWRECAERGIGFAAYSVPSLSDVVDVQWAEDMAVPGLRGLYERNKDVRVVEEFLEAEGIPHPSLLGLLHARGQDEYLYYLFDGHFTPRGAEVAAEVLFEFLWPRADEWCRN
jgi:hypothetical protein